jgi:hypothetical protein
MIELERVKLSKLGHDLFAKKAERSPTYLWTWSRRFRPVLPGSSRRLPRGPATPRMCERLSFVALSPRDSTLRRSFDIPSDTRRSLTLSKLASTSRPSSGSAATRHWQWSNVTPISTVHISRAQWTRPFTPEEKKLIADNVYAHVWQQAMSGEFAKAA